MEQLKSFFLAVKESGLRKVSVGVYFFSVLSVLVGLSRIQDGTYQAIVMALVAALFTANAAEHFAKKD